MGQGRWQGGSGHDPHYQTWRKRQMHAHDEGFKALNEGRQKRFESDFEDWRKTRSLGADSGGRPSSKKS